MTMFKTMHGAQTPRTAETVALCMGTVCALSLVAEGSSGPPPLSGGSSTGAGKATATTSADGASLEGEPGDAPLSGMGGMEPMLIILVVFGGIILFSVFGQRKEKKRRARMLSAIKKNDSVQTIGGVIGSVVEVKNETVVIRVDDRADTRMTFSRAAVQQVLAQPDSTED